MCALSRACSFKKYVCSLSLNNCPLFGFDIILYPIHFSADNLNFLAALISFHLLLVMDEWSFEFWLVPRHIAFFFLLLSTLGSVNIIAKNQNICFLVQQLTTLAVAASLLATSPARASSLDSCIAFPSRKCGSPLRPCSASKSWAFLR